MAAAATLVVVETGRTDDEEARGRVLVVEDDVPLGKVLCGLLEQIGVETRHVVSAEDGLNALVDIAFDAVLTDLRLPGMDGVALLRELGRREETLPVVMLTAHGSLSVAVEAMKAGAVDFLTKPFDREEVQLVVRQALARAGAERGGPPPLPPPTSMLVGATAPMREVAEVVARAARSNATVLIRGESGTGKEVAARAIHESGPRKAGPFVAVNAAALPDQLLESELFGYERGAFTGAVSRKPGRVELAEGGTLFLDEIGDASPAVQVKLLRLLQTHEYEPLGGTRVRRADVRFIAATHRDLEAMIDEGTFREDLFYRLDVIPLGLPPLRARKSDLPALARLFCQRLAADNHRPGLRLSPAAEVRLADHDWPGNVRELQSFVERLVVFSDGELIDDSDVDRELRRRSRGVNAGPARSGRAPSSGEPLSLTERRATAERAAVEEALERAGGNRSQAARLLGVSRRKLYNMLGDLARAPRG